MNTWIETKTYNAYKQYYPNIIYIIGIFTIFY